MGEWVEITELGVWPKTKKWLEVIEDEEVGTEPKPVEPDPNEGSTLTGAGWVFTTLKKPKVVILLLLLLISLFFWSTSLVRFLP